MRGSSARRYFFLLASRHRALPIARELNGGLGVPTAGKHSEKLCLIRACSAQAIAHLCGGNMKRFGLGVVVAIGLTLPAFEQEAVDPEGGVYVLNPAKSTFRGPGIRTQVLYVGKETSTVVGFLANGKSFSATFPNGPIDGQSHPAPDAIAFDAQTSTRLDPYTVKTVRTKDGKVTQTLIAIYNPDAKALTVTAIGTATIGSAQQSLAHVWVFEKQ
jgi:hypothetical protein